MALNGSFTSYFHFSATTWEEDDSYCCICASSNNWELLIVKNGVYGCMVYIKLCFPAQTMHIGEENSVSSRDLTLRMKFNPLNSKFAWGESSSWWIRCLGTMLCQECFLPNQIYFGMQRRSKIKHIHACLLEQKESKSSVAWITVCDVAPIPSFAGYLKLQAVIRKEGKRALSLKEDTERS